MSELAARLLGFLRAELRDAKLEFSEPPTPVSGGFDTQIFAFRLSGERPPAARAEGSAAAGPLILRLLGRQHDPARALREGALQNAVADLGYPAPRVLWASADVSHLGGAFLVMERRAGRPLLKARRLNAGAILADSQMRLHDLEVGAVVRALDREGPALRGSPPTFGAYLTRLEDQIAEGGLDGLRPALRWLVERRLPEPARLSICHGDFHPHNLLCEGDTVTGVLDWPNALVADRAFDVASTVVILGQSPAELWSMSPLLRWIARVGRPLLVRRYLAAYRRRRPLAAEVLSYYEVANAMRHMVRAAVHRLGPASASNPLEASSFADNLAAHVARITGIVPALPPARR